MQAETPEGKAIAVKALSLRGLADWKQLDLFEREAKMLESLSHPGIPRYLEYFEEDTDRDKGFFLVQVGFISLVSWVLHGLSGCGQHSCCLCFCLQQAMGAGRSA